MLNEQNYSMKKLLLFLFLSISSLVNISYSQTIAHKAGDDETVNILTWWGYLDKPWVPPYIKQQCGVNVSFDEYYTNEEFERRWSTNKNNYDIVIFEDTFYNSMAHDLQGKGTDLSKIANNYYPSIKKRYFSKKYGKNILYFFQATTGFIWNPKTINLLPGENIEKIFNDARGHSIIILDDPTVVLVLFQSALKNNQSFNLEDFDKITKGTKVYIINDYNKLYENENFAISYIWSGEAILDSIKAQKNYKIMISPTFSYISSDLIAQVSKTPESSCVARTLGSKAFLTRLQNDTYYFSPYANMDSITLEPYRNLYQQYVKNLNSLKWIDSISINESQKIDEAWKLIKLRASQ
ncbi:MAG: hypothetical protein K0S08_716 [Gammaproteobacteria bacterium]|jgi:hypothetical protein|nr:hypothetical protein [Gammaproteobacteria bacterium]